MIFVTVGDQIPFDRLVQAVDGWAAGAGRGDVLAQIGCNGARPRHIAWRERLAPAEFRRQVAEARLVVGHAGMGTILTALELGRPLLVMPRRGALRETRNDHQVATAERFGAAGKLFVAMDERELVERLDGLLADPAGLDNARIGPFASAELLAALHGFIHEDRRRDRPRPQPHGGMRVTSPP